DIELYSNESRGQVVARFHTLRQQLRKAASEFNQALADFVAPKSADVLDYIGAFVVTAEAGLDEHCARFAKEHDDYNSIMAKALADRLAEAFAEWLHKRARQDWGYGRGEQSTRADLINERYRGIRPAPGYPSLPDHTEKRSLFDLLHAEQKAGIQLTVNYAITPASSACGLSFSPPSARYVTVVKLARYQVEDSIPGKG